MLRTIIKFFLRLLASLASAVILVSGYMFFVNLSAKNKEELEPCDDSSTDAAQEKAEQGKTKN